MSAPAPAGGSSKPWLIGAGIGCGCLSLAAVAIVIVIILIGAASHSGGQAQGPGPGAGQGPAPGAGQSPGAAPGGFQIQVATVHVDQNNQPGQPADVFQAGEMVGAVAQLVAVPQAANVGSVWLKIEGERGTPVVAPRTRQVSPDQAGKGMLFTLAGAPAGQYAFVVFLPGTGDQIQPLAAHKFEVR